MKIKVLKTGPGNFRIVIKDQTYGWCIQDGKNATVKEIKLVWLITFFWKSKGYLYLLPRKSKIKDRKLI